VLNIKKIQCLKLPRTAWATSACCGRPLPFYLKLRNGMEAVRAPGSKVYKNIQKANQLRIATLSTKSLFIPFAMHSTFKNLDIFS
jgi:hypothetical protein